MRYIGIDMSKKTFHAALNEDSVKIFQNDENGFLEFENILKQMDFNVSETLIGVEATGIYHISFCHWLSEKKWIVNVINPLITSRQIKRSIRCVKSDKKDSLSIRKTIMGGAGYQFNETRENIALKALLQKRWSLVKMAQKCLQLKEVQDYRMAVCKKEFIDDLSELRTNIKDKIKRIEKEAKTYMSEDQKLLQTIPGIGKICAAYLVGYIGDIRRFSTPEKLVAYIGIDSRVYESGTSIHGKGYITKRGNKYLRHILYLGALAARRCNPQLKLFFEKKISEGKHYSVASCAVERKLIHLIHAVWKRKTPFTI